MANGNPFQEIQELDVDTTYEKWKEGEVSLLDVREPDEWELGHVEGSAWIPLGHLPYRWEELDRTKKWVCVCRMGTRSYYAAAMLQQAGLDASNMEGGMLEWKAAGLPITAPGIVEAH